MFDRRTLIAAAIASLAAAGCGKHTVQESAGIPISFSGSVETKALLDNSGLQAETILINDIHVAADGTPSIYMKDVELRNAGGQWETDPVYYWTKGGSHHFTAHIAGQGLEFISGGSNRNADRLSSTAEITLGNDNQPDILYAFAERDMQTAANPTATVSLKFSHALAAVRININNVSREYFRLASCSFEGIGTSAGMEIYRSGGPQFNGLSGQEAISYPKSLNETIPEGQTLTLYTDVDADGSLLVWPQSLGSAILVLEYFGDPYSHTSETQKIPLAGTGLSNWLSGKRYTYDISLSDENINVTFSIVPWTVNDVTINT